MSHSSLLTRNWPLCVIQRIAIIFICSRNIAIKWGTKDTEWELKARTFLKQMEKKNPKVAFTHSKMDVVSLAPEYRHQYVHHSHQSAEVIKLLNTQTIDQLHHCYPSHDGLISICLSMDLSWHYLHLKTLLLELKSTNSMKLISKKINVISWNSTSVL